MALVRPIINAFNGGEASPEMEGRTDFTKYPSLCKRMENMIPLVQGPATRRPGTRFVCAVPDHDVASRCMRFEFSPDQAYELIFGDAIAHICVERARLAYAATDAALVNGAIDNNLNGWTDVSNGTGEVLFNSFDNGKANLNGNGSGNEAILEQAVTIDAAYVDQPHTVRFAVRGDRAGDKLTVCVGSTSGGTEILAEATCELGWHVVTFAPTATTFYLQFRVNEDQTTGVNDVAINADGIVALGLNVAAADDLWRIKTTQSQDQQWQSHPSHWPVRLERRGVTDWSLVRVLFTDGPWLEENADTTMTLQPSATSGTNKTVTAAGHAPFVSTDRGRLIRIKHSTTWGVAVVTNVNSSTVVTVDILVAFGATTAQSAWRLGLWSETTGFPAASTFHGERLVFLGAAIARPQAVAGSKVSDFENHTPGTDDADAFLFNIASDINNTGRWLASKRALLVGMAGGEASLAGASDRAKITPSSVNAQEETVEGCADIAALKAGNAVLFVQRHGRRVNELSFVFADDQYTAPDLTELAEHITETGIREMAFHKDPWNTAWATRADGLLIGMTYKREQDVVAWHRHPVGGSFAGGAAVVESVSTIPGANGDETWLTVKRTIDGATRRYVEVMTDRVQPGQRDDDFIHVDCSVTFDNPVTVTGIANDDPVVVTAPAHGAANGDSVKIVGVRGMTAVNDRVYIAADVTADTLALTDAAGDPVDGTAFGVYAGGGELRVGATVFSGVDHLEGETCSLWVDGGDGGDVTISAGGFTTAAPAFVVHCGLPAPFALQPMRLEGGSRIGSAQGALKRIVDVTIRFIRSLGVKVGRDADNLEDVIFQDPSLDVGVPPVRSGDFTLPFNGDADTDGLVLIAGDRPGPCTVACLIPTFDTEDS